MLLHHRNDNTLLQTPAGRQITIKVSNHDRAFSAKMSFSPDLTRSYPSKLPFEITLKLHWNYIEMTLKLPWNYLEITSMLPWNYLVASRHSGLWCCLPFCFWQSHSFRLFGPSTGTSSNNSSCAIYDRQMTPCSRWPLTSVLLCLL